MIQKAVTNDSRILAEMAIQIWDSHTIDELDAEFREMLNCPHFAFLSSTQTARPLVLPNAD